MVDAATEDQSAKWPKTLGRLLGRVKSSMSTTPADQRAESEIQSYLQEKVIDGDDNLLEWWKVNGSRFPLFRIRGKKIPVLP